MISTVYKDNLPRTLTWPVASAQISKELEGVIVFDEVVMYQLFDSEQKGLYKSNMVESEAYPVFAVQAGVPKVKGDKKAELIANDPKIRSVIVFPVKLRFKEDATKAIMQTGMRALKNWFIAAGRSAEPPKTLVLWFNEHTGAIMPKFAPAATSSADAPQL